MAKHKDFQWVKWLLAGSLALWSTAGMAWSFGSAPQAPVEEAQADDSGTTLETSEEAQPEVSQPEADASDQQEEKPSYTTERATWEDSAEESRGERGPAIHQEASADQDSDASSNVEQLSRQVNNIVNMNLPGRIDELQQAVARLRGQLQVQQHQVQQLKLTLSARAKARPVFKSALKVSAKPVAPSAVAAAQSQDTAASSQKAYSQAFDALMKKQYSEAKTAFLDYVQRYPNGAYISNAYYWLAEIALVKRDYDAAQKRLNIVIKLYPTSSKYPDARYKLAMTHLKMHQTAKAREELQALSHEYAGKTVGRLASIALEQLDLDQ